MPPCEHSVLTGKKPKYVVHSHSSSLTVGSWAVGLVAADMVWQAFHRAKIG